jgi:putative ABC transport system permease protein
MNIATRGIRNAFRNTTRTLSIVTILGMSIGLSLVMLIANQAVGNKIKTTLSTIGNTISVSPASFSSGSTSNGLTSDQIAAVKKLPHVASVTATLETPLQTEGTTSEVSGVEMHRPANVTDGGSIGKTSLKSILTFDATGLPSGATVPKNFSPTVSIVGTSRPTDPAAIEASSLTVTAGKAIDGAKDNHDAMISTTMAEKNGLKVGSTFAAYGETFTVVGLFDSKTQTGNNAIIVSLPTLQHLTKKTDKVAKASVTVDSLEYLSGTTDEVKKIFGTAADVTSEVAKAKQTLQPLDSVKNISLYSLVGAVAASAIIILLTMIMIVRERRREIGILKAIGASNIRIMLQFMFEALTFTVIGTAIGLGLGIVAGSPVTSTLVSNSNNAVTAATGSGAANGSVQLLNGAQLTTNLKDVNAEIGWTILAYGFGAALLIALVGSALAAFFISKVRPAQVLRSE